MAKHEVSAGSVLRKRWDDDTRTYTEWDAAGQQVESRPYTLDENAEADARAAAEAEEANKATIEDRASTALVDNAAYLDIAAPTNVETLTQVKALTRQSNGLIRLLLQRFDSTE